MTQHRLNYLMTLHIHRDLTDKIDLIATANEFIHEHDHRELLFGKFKNSDMN